MIFQTFDNREIIFIINNKIEKSIEIKVKTISILRIFISSSNNLILMFEKIIEVARVVHQSTSIKKKKNKFKKTI